MRGGEILAARRRRQRPPTVSVDGFAEANTGAAEASKAPRTGTEPAADLRAAAAVGRQREGSAMARGSTEHRRRRGGSSPAQDVHGSDVDLGQLHAYDGEMSEAIAQFEQASRIAETDFPAAMPDSMQSARRRAPAQSGDGQRALSRARRSLPASSRSAPPCGHARTSTRRRLLLKALGATARRRRSDVAAQRGLHGHGLVSRRRARSDPHSSRRLSRRPRRRRPLRRHRRRSWPRFVLLGGRRHRGRLRQRRRARHHDVEFRQLRRQCSCSGVARRPFLDQAARGRSRRAARRPQPGAGRLRQRRLQGRARAARRLGACRSASRCCATTATARSPT